MPDLSLNELETTAAAYEERLVPALFQHWTEPMVEAARISAGQRVLDVACGSGVLARAVAARVGPGGSAVGLDMNPGMLAVAARIAPTIEWHRGRAEALPFDDRSFDAVVSQFGLTFFPEREAALREMHRVLLPGGSLTVAVFEGLEQNLAYAAMASVLERRVGAEIADALRFPFALGDEAELLGLFRAAGMASVAAASVTRTAHFRSVRDMVLADVEGWFPLAGFTLDEDAIGTLVEAAAKALATVVASDGAVCFPVHARIATARKI